MLTADDGPHLALLHGSGGDGKSGVAFEVVEEAPETAASLACPFAWTATGPRTRRSSSGGRLAFQAPLPTALRRPPVTGLRGPDS